MFFERPKAGEAALLVNVELALEINERSSARELKELALSAGAQVVEQIAVKLRTVRSSHLLGKGKLEQIKSIVSTLNITLVIFNFDLSPVQERNIEKLLCCRVLSRTALILDIFASRAQSHSGKLQVELAQLKHLSTRLVRGWTHLERQKGGIGLRGPGETQLELDKRMIGERIKNLKARLSKLHSQRQQTRKYRKNSNIPTVALVGYTNAGKSTLFNSLTAAGVLSENKLFATLDTTSRMLTIPGVGKVTLVDTVGFVQNLPHDLVEAFYATLEETQQADLLLHIIDISDKEYDLRINQVNDVLKQLKADKIPTIEVLNKSDLLAKVHETKPEQICVSAKNGFGLESLISSIASKLPFDMLEGELVISTVDSKIISKLYALQAVKSEVLYSNNSVRMVIKISAFAWSLLCREHSQLANMLTKVTNEK